MNQNVTEQEIIEPRRPHPAEALAKPRATGNELTVSENVAVLVSDAEIDKQIATAKRYPRQISGFVDNSTALACMSEAIAESCIYAVPRDGKTVEGPSARFAEIVQHSWGNCRAGARVVSEGAQFITAMAVFHDLESNAVTTIEVQRRITKSNGNRYSADMIQTTGNAAMAIALRNAVLKGVPKPFWQPAYEAARRAVMGDFQTLANRRDAVFKAFQAYGVTDAEIFALLKIDGADDIGPTQIVTLRGVLTALRDGEVSVEEAFNRKAPQAPSAPAAPQASGQPSAPQGASGQPARQPGQPRTDDTPYDQMGRPVAHDGNTGEVFESFDLDAWHESLDRSLAGCKTQEELVQTWDNEASGLIDDGLVPSLYQQQAEATYQRHVERVMKGSKAKPKASAKKGAPVAPSAPPAPKKAPLSNDESDKYLANTLDVIGKVKTQDALDDLETDFKENWKPRLLDPDVQKVETTLRDRRAQLMEFRA